MALITCPECGKEISSKASSCPNCGYPIAKEIQSNTELIMQDQKQLKWKVLGTYFYVLNSYANTYFFLKEKYKKEYAGSQNFLNNVGLLFEIRNKYAKEVIEQAKKRLFGKVVGVK